MKWWVLYVLVTAVLRKLGAQGLRRRTGPVVTTQLEIVLHDNTQCAGAIGKWDVVLQELKRLKGERIRVRGIDGTLTQELVVVTGAGLRRLYRDVNKAFLYSAKALAGNVTEI